jgi:hypothetical protein
MMSEVGRRIWRVWRRPLLARGTPPTVPMGRAPQFHCPECRRDVPTSARICAGCGADLRTPGR